MELNNALRDAAQSGDAETYARLMVTHICYNDAAYALRSHELDRAQSHRYTWAKATDKGVSPDFAAKLTEALTRLANVAPVVVTDPAQPDPKVAAMIRGYEAGKRYAASLKVGDLFRGSHGEADHRGLVGLEREGFGVGALEIIKTLTIWSERDSNVIARIEGKAR